MTRLYKNVMIVAVLALTMMVAPGNAWAVANALPLSTLLANPNFQIISGDKSFTNFGGFRTEVDGGAVAVNPANILVSAYTDPVTGDYGVVFTNINAPQWVVLPGQLQDTYWNFDAKVIPGFDFLIHDNTLAFSGHRTTLGSIDVREAVFDGQTAIVDFLDPKHVYQHPDGSKLEDHREFPNPLPSVTVFKWVHLEDDFEFDFDGPIPATNSGPTHIDAVYQTFSQVPTVPEPLTGTLSLIAIFGLGLTATRRHRPA